MARSLMSKLNLAVIDAFGAVQALNGVRPTTEDGTSAHSYLLPAQQFHKLIVAAVRYGSAPAWAKLSLSASRHMDSDTSPSLWTAAEATLDMRNVATLYDFEVKTVALPEGALGRLMQLRQRANVIDLTYGEGELIFHAMDSQIPLIMCSDSASPSFRSSIYRHGIEAYELEHSCPMNAIERAD